MEYNLLLKYSRNFMSKPLTHEIWVDDLVALKIALNDPRGQKKFFLRNLVQWSSNVPRMVEIN